MSKTIIYSCGKGMTSKQLLETTDDTANVDMFFPELGRGADVVPLTEQEQVEMLPELIGKKIITVSETIILVILREVRQGRLPATEVELYCNGQRVEFSPDGQMIDPWAGGFFETGFNLRFS
jgi:hypothetical protein